jgi:hypothetical protein
MGKKLEDNFTAIPQWYWECGLSLLEVNIISRIASWQRQKKEFFEGYDSLEKLGWGHYNTIRNHFIKLEKKGLIQKNGKNKRAWKWIVKLDSLRSLHSNNQCKNNDIYLQPVLEIVTPDVSYKNTKNSNKTIFSEGEEKRSSPSQPEKKPKITNTDMDILVHDLDFTNFNI